MRKLYWGLLGTVMLGSVVLAAPELYNNKIETEKERHDREVSQMIEIYNKLIINSGSPVRPQLKMMEDTVINAWTDGEYIYMTYAMLDFINGNEHKLAWLLAHELSHSVLHHMQYPEALMDSRQMESQADKIGTFIMLKSGYDICEGRKLMLEFMKTFGDFPETYSHPDFAHRIYQMDMPWCVPLKG